MDGIGATAVICAVLVMICVFGVVSYVGKLKHGCCGAGSDTVKRVKPQDRDVSHYPYALKVGVEGMHCKNCALRIENAFNALPGCTAKVNLSGKYVVVHSKEPLAREEAKQVIWRTGYQAVEDTK